MSAFIRMPIWGNCVIYIKKLMYNFEYNCPLDIDIKNTVIAECRLIQNYGCVT